MRITTILRDKVLSALLVATMLIGMVPLEASADSIYDDEIIYDTHINVDETDDKTIDTVYKAMEEINYSVPGMPEGYILTEDEVEIKQNIISHDVAGKINNLKPGTDYSTDEVICFSDSRAHAEDIAKAYGGYLKDYGYGVATIGLDESGLSVEEAVIIGANSDANIPAVEPNYICSAGDNNASFCSDMDSVESLASDEIYAPSARNWQSVYASVEDGGLGFNDPALNPQNESYQWYHDIINTYEAWGITTGSTDITVAVLCNGVNLEHEDIGSNVSVYDIGLGAGENGADGTRMIGLLAAKPGNGVGGAGIAPNISVLSIDIYNSEEKSYLDADLIKSYNYLSGYSEVDGQLIKDSNRRADIICNLVDDWMNDGIYDAQREKAIKDAYESGITVVSGANRDWSNAKFLPGSYESVICVSAVDRRNEREHSSNFGEWVDVAAPGDYIWCPDINGNNSYIATYGTRPATSIVAGACALYMSVFGHTDPDTMKQVLKSSIDKKTSSETSPGCINIANMLAGKASAPDISFDNDKGTIAIKTDTYKNGCDKNAIIIYTTDGKDPVVKNGIVTSGKLYTDPIELSFVAGDADKSSKVTVKAICITSTGEVSSIGTMVIPVKKSTTGGMVEEITIAGQKLIIPGGSATFKVVSIIPIDANNKSVSWSVADSEGNPVSGVSISNKGVVKVDKTAAPKSGIVVTASALDGSGTKGIYSFNVVEKAAQIRVSTPSEYESKPLFNVKKSSNSITSFKLFSANIDDGKDFDEHKLVLKADVLSKSGNSITGSDVKWSTSNGKVVIIEGEGNEVVIKAVGKGKANITCMAQDGSKKKAVIKVQVSVPVSRLTILPTGKWGYTNLLSYGKSVQIKACAGETYGIPDNSKVKWDYDFAYEVYGFDKDGNQMETLTGVFPNNDELKKKKLVNISNGKLKIADNKKFSDAINSSVINLPDEYENKIQSCTYKYPILVKATTVDGTNITAEYKIYPIWEMTSVGVHEWGDLKKTVKSGRRKITYTTRWWVPKNEDTIELEKYKESYDEPEFIVMGAHRFWSPNIKQWVINDAGSPESRLTVVSSNPSVATGYFTWGTYDVDDNGLKWEDMDVGKLIVIPESKGTTTFTFYANDGTGVKGTFKLTVK